MPEPPPGWQRFMGWLFGNVARAGEERAPALAGRLGSSLDRTPLRYILPDMTTMPFREEQAYARALRPYTPSNTDLARLRINASNASPTDAVTTAVDRLKLGIDDAAAIPTMEEPNPMRFLEPERGDNIDFRSVRRLDEIIAPQDRTLWPNRPEPPSDVGELPWPAEYEQFRRHTPSVSGTRGFVDSFASTRAYEMLSHERDAARLAWNQAPFGPEKDAARKVVDAVDARMVALEHEHRLATIDMADRLEMARLNWVEPTELTKLERALEAGWEPVYQSISGQTLPVPPSVPRTQAALTEFFRQIQLPAVAAAVGAGLLPSDATAAQETPRGPTARSVDPGDILDSIARENALEAQADVSAAGYGGPPVGQRHPSQLPRSEAAWTYPIDSDRRYSVTGDEATERARAWESAVAPEGVRRGANYILGIALGAPGLLLEPEARERYNRMVGVDRLVHNEAVARVAGQNVSPEAKAAAFAFEQIPWMAAFEAPIALTRGAQNAVVTGAARGLMREPLTLAEPLLAETGGLSRREAIKAMGVGAVGLAGMDPKKLAMDAVDLAVPVPRFKLGEVRATEFPADWYDLLRVNKEYRAIDDLLQAEHAAQGERRVAAFREAMEKFDNVDDAFSYLLGRVRADPGDIGNLHEVRQSFYNDEVRDALLHSWYDEGAKGGIEDMLTLNPDDPAIQGMYRDQARMHQLIRRLEHAFENPGLELDETLLQSGKQLQELRQRMHAFEQRLAQQMRGRVEGVPSEEEFVERAQHLEQRARNLPPAEDDDIARKLWDEAEAQVGRASGDLPKTPEQEAIDRLVGDKNPIPESIQQRMRPPELPTEPTPHGGRDYDLADPKQREAWFKRGKELGYTDEELQGLADDLSGELDQRVGFGEDWVNMPPDRTGPPQEPWQGGGQAIADAFGVEAGNPQGYTDVPWSGGAPQPPGVPPSRFAMGDIAMGGVGHAGPDDASALFDQMHAEFAQRVLSGEGGEAKATLDRLKQALVDLQPGTAEGLNNWLDLMAFDFASRLPTSGDIPKDAIEKAFIESVKAMTETPTPFNRMVNSSLPGPHQLWKDRQANDTMRNVVERLQNVMGRFQRGEPLGPTELNLLANGRGWFEMVTRKQAGKSIAQTQEVLLNELEMLRLETAALLRADVTITEADAVEQAMRNLTMFEH